MSSTPLWENGTKNYEQYHGERKDVIVNKNDNVEMFYDEDCKENKET